MKLSVAHLRAILRAHDVLEVGAKEELTARVGLLKKGHQKAAFSHEPLSILHQIATARKLLRNQGFRSRIIHKRTLAHGKNETLTTQKLPPRFLEIQPTYNDATSSRHHPGITYRDVVKKKNNNKTTNKKNKMGVKCSKRVKKKISPDV